MLRRLLFKPVKQNMLGRWSVDVPDTTINRKIDLANCDSCGSCGTGLDVVRKRSFVVKSDPFKHMEDNVTCMSVEMGFIPIGSFSVHSKN